VPVVVETMVRMGELSVSDNPGDVLVSIGLGSCIGLALLDTGRPLAGLAHVMLPESSPGETVKAKFADLAVPALVEQLVERGARRSQLRAVLVGGAKMFSFTNNTLDIGARNDSATQQALAQAGIPIAETATGGSKGRTIRVLVEQGLVICKEAGGTEVELYRGAA
jgi:chemotaxis protein CheD